MTNTIKGGVLLSMLGLLWSLSRPAPLPERLTQSAGEIARASPDRGVIINYWASWCGPCRQELPLLSERADGWRRQQVGVLAVNLDEDARLANEYLLGASLNLSLSAAAASERSLWLAQGIPQTLLLDANGEIIRRWQGAMTEQDLQQLSQMVSRLPSRSRILGSEAGTNDGMDTSRTE
ncbi:TlpA family protein disulfide reductase [Ferrimonas sediminicola]|nr:TlpA disulfide reductase family protein [Ferrimonas sediminicola]